MIMEADITQSNLKHVEVRRGFEFVFNINNEIIRAGGAMFSGSEYVYLNDKLISQTKTQRTVSSHEFVINNENYRIEFEIMNKLTGILCCRLYINDNQERVMVTTPLKSRFTGPLIFIIVFGGLLLNDIYSLNFPLYYIIIVLAIAAIVDMTYRYNHVQITDISV